MAKMRIEQLKGFAEKISPFKVFLIKSMRQEGYTIRDIIKIVDVSEPTVQKYSKGVSRCHVQKLE